MKTEKYMKNMKYMGLIAVAVLAATVAVQQAQANPVTGAITFAGGVELDTTTVNTATEVIASGWQNPYVQSDSGSFAGIPTLTLGLVTIASPWTFTSGPIAGFWSVGGFTFDLTASAISSQGGGFLSVEGYGWISGNGYDATEGTWKFSTQDSPSGTPLQFSFSAANSIPDGGLTVALLGGAMVALQAFRRKLLK